MTLASQRQDPLLFVWLQSAQTHPSPPLLSLSHPAHPSASSLLSSQKMQQFVECDLSDSHITTRIVCERLCICVIRHCLSSSGTLSPVNVCVCVCVARGNMSGTLCMSELCLTWQHHNTPNCYECVGSFPLTDQLFECRLK